MSAPKLHVIATYLSAKTGTNPPIRIGSPIVITEYIGEQSILGYDVTNEKLQEMVDNKECGLFFHRDLTNNYLLDDDTFANGAIYGLKEKMQI